MHPISEIVAGVPQGFIYSSIFDNMLINSILNISHESVKNKRFMAFMMDSMMSLGFNCKMKSLNKYYCIFTANDNKK